MDKAAINDDLGLIERVARGDQAALQALFARHNVRLYRFLMRYAPSEAIAEELMNETFLEVWTSAGKFAGRSSVSSWMFAIGRNKAISLLRKRREDVLDEHAASRIADDADTPEVTAQKSDKATQIRVCIEQLSHQHREVIDLVYYHEKSIKEISDIVGIPENTVKTRMFHARKNLSVHLENAGVDRGWP